MRRPPLLALVALAVLATGAPAQTAIVEPHSGVSFPASLTPPGSSATHWITGAGVRELTVFIVTVKIYAFGLYLERAGARASLAG